MSSVPVDALPATFGFRHPDLRRPGVAFVRDDGRDPILKLQLGDLQGSLPLDRLAASLQLAADDPDRRLLALVPAALCYMRQVRPDDPLPSELTDGRPSWTPRPHVVQRAVAVVWRALQGPIALLEPGSGLPAPERQHGAGPAAAAADLRLAARALLGLLPGTTMDEAETRLQAVILDVARVDWLRRATATLQRTVGELAQLAAKRASDPVGDMARRSALLLRDAAVWSTEKAMAGDVAVGDVNRLLAEPDLLRSRAWPLIGALRAMILDVEPVMLQWQQANAQPGGPRPHDLEQILRLTTQRYGQFEPSQFLCLHAVAGLAAGGFDAR
jgi:hypothetical protein